MWQLYAPAILAGAKQIGGIIAGTALATAVGGQASAVLSPENRNTLYNANRNRRNLWPSINDLVRIYNQGMISEDSVKDALSYHGIGRDWSWWSKVIDSQSGYPPLDLILSLYWRNFISPEKADEWAARHGFRLDEVREVFFKQPFVWSPEQVRVFESLGKLDPEKANRFLGAAGMMRAEDRNLFTWTHQVPTPQDCLELRNRDDIDDVVLTRWLKMNGMTDRQVRENFEGLRHQIPTPSDLVTFAVKEAFDPAVVARFGYDKEFPAEFDYWMKKTSYGGDPTDKGKVGKESGLKSWAQAYWRAHWRPISPEQAYRMEQRLRPTGGPDGGPRVPGVRPWTRDDTNAILKVQDYPEPFRDRLAALSYNVLRLVDIRRIVRLSLADSQFKARAVGESVAVDDWAYEQFRDRGQTEADARALAVLAVQEGNISNRAKSRAILAQWFRVVLDQYAVGVIDKTDAEFWLERLRGRLEISPRLTEWSLDIADIRVSLAIVKSTVKCVRASFLKGKLNAEQAAARLAEAGIVAARVTQYVDSWTACHDEARRHMTTAQIIGLYKDGYLSYQEAAERLENIGWQRSDLMLMLAKVSKGLDALRGAMHGAAGGTTLGTADALEALYLDAENLRAEISQAISRLTPIELVNYLYQRGRFSDADYISRMLAMGFDHAGAEEQLAVQRELRGKQDGAATIQS